MARRSPGEGSVYPQRDRKGGKVLRYRGAFRHEGKLYTVSAKTRAEARRNLDQLKADLLKEPEQPASAQTLSEFAADWLSNTVRPQRAYNTYHNYESALRLHVLPHLGALPLREVTPQRVQAMIAALQVAGASPTVQRMARLTLAVLLNRAVRWRMLAYNPASLVDVPPAPRSVRHDVPVELLPAFRAAIAGHRLEALYLLIISAGLRIGEVLGLTWRELDLEAGCVRVVQQLQWQRPEPGDPKVPVLKAPKRQASNRTIYLGPAILRALRHHRSRQHQERLAAGSCWLNTDLVFTRPDGAPLHASQARKLLYRLLASAGLERRCFHELRHSFISLLIREAQADPRTAAELAGHANTAITLDVYAHSSEAAKRAAANRLDALFGE